MADMNSLPRGRGRTPPAQASAAPASAQTNGTGSPVGLYRYPAKAVLATEAEENSSANTNGTGGAASKCGCNSSNQSTQNCTSSEQVFGLAASLSVFFWSQLTVLEIQTLINLLTLLVANLSTMVIQKQLCEGLIITPPE